MKVTAWPAFSTKKSNPYNSLLYDAMRKQGVEVLEFEGLRSLSEEFDIFHVHWPDLSLKKRSLKGVLIDCTQYLVAVFRVRRRGVRVVWTAHNLRSHENLHPFIEPLFWFLMRSQLDGVISLSEAGRQQVREARLGRSKIPTACIPHGHYRDVYPNQISRAYARLHFGISATAFVVGWVGQIRAYKGLQDLMSVWPSCPAREKVLLAGGKSDDPQLRESLEQYARGDTTILFRDGRVEDDDMQLYFNAADVIVLPYRKILNSGSALLGLSFNRPVALPYSEVMAELQQQVGTDWVYLYRGEFNDKILKEIFEWTLGTSRPAQAPMGDLDWNLLAGKTRDFFQELVAGKGKGDPS